MDDTYLGNVWVCSCCQLRKSECPCPCDAYGCDNRHSALMEQFYYDRPIVRIPPAFVKVEL